MAIKLTNDILSSINEFVESFDEELVSASANHVQYHWGCNGCSGDCNMTAKGGCGKYG